MERPEGGGKKGGQGGVKQPEQDPEQQQGVRRMQEEVGKVVAEGARPRFDELTMKEIQRSGEYQDSCTVVKAHRIFARERPPATWGVSIVYWTSSMSMNP